MENVFQKSADLFDHVKAYVNNRLALLKLQVASRTAKLLSDIIAFSMVAAFVFLFVFMLSVALALVIGEMVGAEWAGFLCVAICWLLIALLVWYKRAQWLRIPIMNVILQQLSGDEKDQQHE